MMTNKISPFFLCLLMSICFVNFAAAQDRKISKKEIKEYKTLIENCYDEDGNPSEVSKADAARIDFLYENMTEKQKKKNLKKNLHFVNPETIGTTKGVSKKTALLPADATYFINEKAVSSEEAIMTITDNRFRMVRKKTDNGYEFHITLL